MQFFASTRYVGLPIMGSQTFAQTCDVIVGIGMTSPEPIPTMACLPTIGLIFADSIPNIISFQFKSVGQEIIILVLPGRTKKSNY